MKKKSRKQEPSLLPFEASSEPPPQFEVVLTRPAAVPVRGAPTPPYDEATWIDSSFTYTARQYQAILETLGNPPNGDTVLEKIQYWARVSHSDASHNQTRPNSEDLYDQLVTLRTRLGGLSEWLNRLHRPTIDALEAVSSYASDTLTSLQDPLAAILQVTIRALQEKEAERAAWGKKEKKQDHNKKRRYTPRKQAVRFFVNQLCEIWEKQTGKKPTSWNSQYEEEYGGAFHKFAVEAVVPVHGRRGVDDIIRKFVKDRRQGEKSAAKR